MSTLKDKIKKLAEAGFKDVIANRRYIHQNPELSFEEVQTGRFIAQKLHEMGIEFAHGIAENGVVALIKGRNPAAKVIALRADIDALPIMENNEVPYRSKNEGVMHACGHDAHTASLLGVAKILHELKDEFEGTIKLIFQPGEEKSPGGASIMIEEGVLENPAPELIIGQHVHPPLHAGKIGMRPGIYMASTDELYMTVTGKGGHGAMPQECIDPIAISAQIIVALQQIVSRLADPTLPSVLTFGKINSTGGATNIIPNEVKLEGTFRTMNEEWREKAHKQMKKLAIGIAESFGAACDFNIVIGYPMLFNNEILTEQVRRFACEYLGEAQVELLPIRMTAEDFAFYAQKIPACFYRLGTGNPSKNITAPLHTANFDIDEDSLLTGIGTMSFIAIRMLTTHNQV
ncbi:MAG: M20 metallopeptidase family protein [Saprospiraceae bacterium]